MRIVKLIMGWLVLPVSVSFDNLAYRYWKMTMTFIVLYAIIIWVMLYYGGVVTGFIPIVNTSANFLSVATLIFGIDFTMNGSMYLWRFMEQFRQLCILYLDS